MRLSHSFIPTMKETPAEAQIASHRLMLRAGLVRQTSAGIYAWLPLGFRVLKNIERIVREEQNAAGAQEVLMPTIQSAELWRESGRYDDYGKEMLRIRDRHERDMLYGPTNEEVITDLFRQSVHSYRELPQILYHIQWKFRDEVRPRFGVMRGREFLMKDAYSFDLDYAGAVVSYRTMMLAYMRTFQRMGLKAIPMEAESGPIGGDLSHEFIILAPTGESQVYYDAAFENIDWVNAKFDYNAQDLEAFFKQMTSMYAATDEKHDAAKWDKVDPARRREGRGIEVGHIFYFGTKYTAGDERHGRRTGWQACASGDGQLRRRRVAPGRRGDRGQPRRGRHHLAGQHRTVQGGDPQSAARRCRVRRDVRGAVREARCRRAVRRSRGAGRGEVRRRRPDGSSLADHRRAARRRCRQGGTEAPRDRRAQRMSPDDALDLIHHPRASGDPEDGSPLARG